MKTNGEVNYPGDNPGGRVNQDFFDDSSSALGLSHSAYDSWNAERLRQKQIADKAQYLEEIGAKDKAARLIEYYRNLGMRPKDAEDAGIERFLSLAAGVYDRMWRYIDSGMEMEVAILSAEKELNDEADIEAQAIEESRGDDRPDDSESLSVRALEDLMDMHRKTKGGGSKSKSRKTITKPDAPVVEQALRRDMAV